jgi:hypothetical protein
LFKTYRIALPRRDAQHLPRIEQGAHNAVTEEIERLLGEIENAAAEASLPETPDPEFITEHIRAHAGRVASAYGSSLIT